MIDLDGTLLDTVPGSAGRGRTHAGATRPAGRSRSGGARLRRQGIARLVERLLTGTRDGEPDAATLRASRAGLSQPLRRGPDGASHPFARAVVEALEALRDRGCALACVTNKAARFTVPLLERMGADAPICDLVLSGDTLARKKPDPLPLLHVCAHVRLAPARMLMIGDSAERRAGGARRRLPGVLRVLRLQRGQLAVHELDCDAIVPTLPDVAR